MNWRRSAIGLLAAAMLLPAAPGTARAQDGAAEYRGATALGLTLRKLGTTKRVLMVGAHPDDEDTQLLARFALEEGADVAYLSLTRGEGGQNGIGPELGEGLGLLRTEELLAARRVDGAEQFFTRAYDFGFSKSADEAFAHWPREALLEDVVRVIRLYRPDVIVTVFSGTPRDGHGQHQVSALLAHEAFAAAADPSRFPGQLREGLRPWQVSKMYQSTRGRTEGATVRLPIGELDPLIGRSPFQLAMASRSRHRSQDMGQPELAGPRWGTLLRIRPDSGGTEPSIWAGLDTTLAPSGGAESQAMRALRGYQQQVETLRAAYNPLQRGSLVSGLMEALETLRQARAAIPVTNGTADLVRAIDVEMAQARTALAQAAGLELDVLSDDARIIPGQAFDLTVQVWNGGDVDAGVDSILPALPAGWRAEPIDTVPAPRTVKAGTLLARRFRVHVPADAHPTEAYFLRAPREGDLYRWPADEPARARPFEPGAVAAYAALDLTGVPLRLEREAQFREVDLRQGELRRPVMIVPAVSVLLDPRTRVLSTAAPRPIAYTVRLASEATDGMAGTLRLELPAGWRAEPASVPVRFAKEGEVLEVRFTVTAPAGVAPGDHPVSAVFAGDDGRTFARGAQLIDYPHVRARPLYHAARSVIRAFDVRVPQGLRVAYIEGAGEQGPGFLANLGITPELLDAADLAEGDLDQFDVIVAGSRAYEVRTDLMAHNQRLLDYVSRGGTFIVQYNKYEIVEGGFTPYPITMARPHGRVTDENAPVRILDPSHPVFTAPNQITDADWRGWVQERGLYFAETWGDAYTPLLEMGDPGETPLRGGLLIARHGQGTYVYTGLAFFRQFPEGVPGAYRLFANLLALGAK
ncbi:PIG-L family deacetylase [Longimicrobium sp.]|uniref:PIG-L family deacetylase n=1 Tax=Longimicrobium sp. TaxID=2029185 RepID=UPI002E34089C|nr:PIG-L family deacetylase [Longimicrobium sp.]HEX6036530.1 PIG-L family deacetylase [Longimicrobium sp.]